MKDFIVSIIGLHTTEESKSLEKLAKIAIREFQPMRDKIKFLEGRIENYEKILKLKEDPYIHFRYDKTLNP